jgi:hypothetical protein
MKSKFKSRKRMLMPRRQTKESTVDRAPLELRIIALLELERRRLRTELAGVEREYLELSREIERKGIATPW